MFGRPYIVAFINDQATIRCWKCKNTYIVVVSEPQLNRWIGREHIQDVMPELTAGEREMLISGTCESCFDKLFKYDDEDEN